LKPNAEPKEINQEHRYVDRWDEHHVRMPCSPYYTFVNHFLYLENLVYFFFFHIQRNGQPRWLFICQALLQLKQKCDSQTATVETLKVIFRLELFSKHQK
jgi:hypothetical protein